MNVVVKESKDKHSIIEFFKDVDVEKIRVEFEGFYVEETDDVYVRKWGKWWRSQ